MSSESGENLVARTAPRPALRLVLAGHTDTVPANGNLEPRVEDDVLWGLGAADMKGGLAVMLELARAVPEPAVDVTYVFYAGEEVAPEHNGLGHLFRDRPDLVAGDVAILGEPTGGDIEAGCQGTMRIEVSVVGARAHTARPWMGRNAIHRMGEVLRLVESFEARRPVLDGCEFREALQAVRCRRWRGWQRRARRSHVDAQPPLCSRPHPRASRGRGPRRCLLPRSSDDDEVRVVDMAPAAAPGLDHPVLAALVERHRLQVRAKLGWTDVARFAAAGHPCVQPRSRGRHARPHGPGARRAELARPHVGGVCPTS